MAYIDTLLINGNDVRTLPGVTAVDFIDGLYAPGTVRGDDDDIPGRAGSLGAQLPFAKYLITIPVTLAGSTTAALNSNLASLTPLIRGTTGLVTLTRHLDNGSGYTAGTANGRYVSGLQVGLVNWTTGQTHLEFYNLDGSWTVGGVAGIVP